MSHHFMTWLLLWMFMPEITWPCPIHPHTNTAVVSVCYTAESRTEYKWFISIPHREACWTSHKPMQQVLSSRVLVKRDLPKDTQLRTGGVMTQAQAVPLYGGIHSSFKAKTMKVFLLNMKVTSWLTSKASLNPVVIYVFPLHGNSV